MDSFRFQILCRDKHCDNVVLFNDIKCLLSYQLDLQVNAEKETHKSALFNHLKSGTHRNKM
jgi:hypothetical protein